MDFLGAVELIADGPDPFLGKPGLAGEVEEPGDVEIGLIAVVVHSGDAGEGVDYRAAAEDIGPGDGEDAVQAGVELVTADGLCEGRGVMRHVESVLPGVALLEAYPGAGGIEGLNELSVLVLGTDEAGRRVVEFLPAVGELHQLTGVLLVAEGFGEVGHCIGAETVFEGVRGAEGRAVAVVLVVDSGAGNVGRIAVFDKCSGIGLAGTDGSVFPA